CAKWVVVSATRMVTDPFDSW
nr:immunoglobulin heavy chain junction region [Macaca mulatta]MOW32953.1 immunoglobulin heavy chain junction region [Macaca mulatta]MOW33178.1 immunoglobulin heavy chain junction region [Macaca mulatta]MOW33257.1 immunoglobulin heavy chain junction region [Macaca mulatta]MOW33451.1 immunoglobulin heavy chain junction region [Macaca mulatta]